ncbi:hypothetical protein U9M48_027233 [Paspalum notatum var. saurae]|uniref:Uncharacterized protein n=1 Tax=Paspalum notatum var. saurae TaxID=547442 RepID=A0AAQ3TUD7_PASNO
MSSRHLSASPTPSCRLRFSLSASSSTTRDRLLGPKQLTDLSEDPDEYDYFDYTGDLEQAAPPELDDDLFFDGRR